MNNYVDNYDSLVFSLIEEENEGLKDWFYSKTTEVLKKISEVYHNNNYFNHSVINFTLNLVGGVRFLNLGIIPKLPRVCIKNQDFLYLKGYSIVIAIKTSKDIASVVPVVILSTPKVIIDHSNLGKLRGKLISVTVQQLEKELLVKIDRRSEGVRLFDS